MFTKQVIVDCNNIFNLLFNSLFNGKSKIDGSDLAILGLFKSFIKNIEAINILIQNDHGNEADTLIRSALEQCIYFDYLFQKRDRKKLQNRPKRECINSIELRGNSLFFWQRFDMYKKVKNVVDDKNIKLDMDFLNKILEKEENFKSIEEATEYFKRKYNELFDKNRKFRELGGKQKRKIRRNWYNVDGGEYKNLEKLAQDVSCEETYHLYRLCSISIHGHGHNSSIWISKQNNDLYINNVSHSTRGNYDFLSSLSYNVMERLIWYYNLKNNTITELKNRVNFNLKLKRIQ